MRNQRLTRAFLQSELMQEIGRVAILPMDRYCFALCASLALFVASLE